MICGMVGNHHGKWQWLRFQLLDLLRASIQTEQWFPQARYPLDFLRRFKPASASPTPKLQRRPSKPACILEWNITCACRWLVSGWVPFWIMLQFTIRASGRNKDTEKLPSATNITPIQASSINTQPHQKTHTSTGRLPSPQ